MSKHQCGMCDRDKEAEKFNKELYMSSCCGDSVWIGGEGTSVGSTHYYVCSGCGQPTDLMPKVKREDCMLPVWILSKTFAVQYNPGCPKRFLIRLVAPGQGRIDLQPYAGVGEVELTKDLLGFGVTLTEAAEEVRKKLEVAEREFDAKHFGK